MPRKKPEKPKASQIQTLQRVRQDDKMLAHGGASRVEIRMAAFIREYERLCGNITATCAVTGISRPTYYRWARGTAKVHRRFQRKIAKILPGEKQVDVAEMVIFHHLEKNDLQAALFVARTKGKSRGWTEKEKDDKPANKTVLQDVAERWRMFFEDHGEKLTTDEEKIKWLRRFAERGSVPPKELGALVGIEVRE